MSFFKTHSLNMCNLFFQCNTTFLGYYNRALIENLFKV